MVQARELSEVPPSLPDANAVRLYPGKGRNLEVTSLTQFASRAFIGFGPDIIILQ